MQRKVFGKPLIEQPVIREKLAQMLGGSGPRLVKGWIFHGLLLGFNHEMMGISPTKMIGEGFYSVSG